MSLRDFGTAKYIPLLSVRPAEMTALEELPARDKDLLLPLISIRAWLGAHRLDSALSRIEEAYGRRPTIVDLSGDEPDGNRRPVHDELDRLKDATEGYANWCEFIAARSNLIPTLQLGDPLHIRAQIERLAALERGVVLRVPEVALPQASVLTRALAEYFPPDDICVVLDFERQTRELLNRQVGTLGIIERIIAAAPDRHISVSASSFPDSFVGLAEQDIYERRFFDGIAAAPAMHGAKLIYGDRGSARAERQTGGGGQPAPRIDYALTAAWRFFREEGDDDRAGAYKAAANRAIRHPSWDADLRLWGTQMIERTALGDPFAIGSPAKSTAARINIHLHQQLFVGAPDGDVHDTDDDWVD